MEGESVVSCLLERERKKKKYPESKNSGFFCVLSSDGVFVYTG
jgi:hypothetical protein